MPCHEYCGTGHEAMWARVQVMPADEFLARAEPRGKAELCSSLGSSSSPTSGSRSSPSSARSCWANGRCTCAARCSAWINNPEHYYRSVTAHGTVMAYVLPTLVAMGFGYAISELALKRPLIGLRWAWAGFWLVVAGTVMAAGDDGGGQGVGALHLLSADDRAARSTTSASCWWWSARGSGWR